MINVATYHVKLNKKNTNEILTPDSMQCLVTVLNKNADKMPLYSLSDSVQSISQLGCKPTSNMIDHLTLKLNDEQSLQNTNFKNLIGAFKFFLNHDKTKLFDILVNTSDSLSAKIESDLDLVSSIYLC